MFNFPIKKVYIFTWFVPFNYPLSRFWKSNILTVPQKNIYTFCGNQPTNLLHLQLFLHIQQGWKKNIQHWKMTHITQYTHFFVMGQRGRYNHLPCLIRFIVSARKPQTWMRSLFAGDDRLKGHAVWFLSALNEVSMVSPIYDHDRSVDHSCSPWASFPPARL